ncbi:aerobic-type carbon monoxide dehydrogenase small subunit (CoxS/CutS family) [Methylorubrum rhodesianum]|nr:aerobic-type carbon monoxide dehydrogenase small subunit (CoxS/CutS family) [Methylorubrum rhodesianum]
MPAIEINGQSSDFDVTDDTPLLWVLRDVAGLTGTKFGCGMALCGCCTVLLDGDPRRRGSLLPPVAVHVGSLGQRR